MRWMRNLLCSGTLTGLFTGSGGTALCSAAGIGCWADGNRRGAGAVALGDRLRWTRRCMECRRSGGWIWRGILSSRISPAVTVGGVFSAQVHCCETKTAELDWDGARVLASSTGEPLLDGDVSGAWDGQTVTVGPGMVDLGGKEPAAVSVAIDSRGYTVRVDGNGDGGRGAEGRRRALPPVGTWGWMLRQARGPVKMDEVCRRAPGVGNSAARRW